MMADFGERGREFDDDTANSDASVFLSCRGIWCGLHVCRSAFEAGDGFADKSFVAVDEEGEVDVVAVGGRRNLAVLVRLSCDVSVVVNEFLIDNMVSALSVCSPEVAGRKEVCCWFAEIFCFFDRHCFVK